MTPGMARMLSASLNPQPSSALPQEIASRLKRDGNGLVCAVIQEASTGDVLMVGWMNDEALARTLSEGRVTFWSRSRQELWRKGDTSGNVQHVVDAHIDCDGDAILLRVNQTGGACHTGRHTCFEAGGELPLFGIAAQRAGGTPSIESGGGSDDGS